MAAGSWSWLALNPLINKTTAPLGLSGTDVCACVMYKSWQLMKATQSCSGKFVRLHNTLAEMSQESQGLGVWREDHRSCILQKNGVSARAACKTPGLGRGSPPQPGREAGVQEVAGEGFHKDLLFGCSDYISVLAIERDLAFGFCFRLYLFLLVLNSLCEYQYSESLRMISAFIKDSFQLPFYCL